jgi:ATP-dependent Clp protease ATP-binding subunit ClpA
MEVEDLIRELFIDRAYNIFTIFSDIIQDDSKTGEMYEEIVKLFTPAAPREIAELEELDEVTNINTYVSDHPQMVINAEEKVKKIEMALSGRSIRNCILTGPAGTGKTTYVYELAQRINRGDVPESFKNKVIYELNATNMVAGTKYRGEFEQRLKNIIMVLKEHPEAILFVDEIHTLISMGGSEGSSGAGDLIKPYISRGEIQIIGCTTDEEFAKNILPDKAFCSRFHEIKIEEPTRNETREILVGLLPVQTEFFNKEIQSDLVEKVLDMSAKYTLEQANPRKAINMLELACAYAKVFEENKEIVDVEDVINSIKLRYNIYISKDKIRDSKSELHKVILGQNTAIEQVLRNLEMVDRGIVDLERPALSMLLAGPSGVGKTETCKILAKTFFGSEENLIKINMGEYSTEMDVTKLTGSAPGYVGSDNESDIVMRIKQKPNSVVLFDEIEKAHPSVQKVLLNILDEGEMKDNHGNRVSFRNCIIVFTTNLGCTKDTGKATGMGFAKTTHSGGKTEILKEIENYFRPEFLGRLDDIVYYSSLTKEIARELIDRYYNEYAARATVKTKFTEEDIEDIIKESEIETRGARGIRKTVRKKIVECERRAEEVKAAIEF